jgi:hypothetical protein
VTYAGIREWCELQITPPASAPASSAATSISPHKSLANR